jgi:hypothetical protein
MSEQSETYEISQAYITATKEIDNKYFSPFIEVLDRLLTELDTHFNTDSTDSKRILVFSYTKGQKGKAELRKLLSQQRTLLSEKSQDYRTSFLRINQEVYLELKKDEAESLKDEAESLFESSFFVPFVPSEVQFSLLIRENSNVPGYYDVQLAGFDKIFDVKLEGKDQSDDLYKFFAKKLKEYYEKLPDYFRVKNIYPESLENMANFLLSQVPKNSAEFRLE